MNTKKNTSAELKRKREIAKAEKEASSLKKKALIALGKSESFILITAKDVTQKGKHGCEGSSMSSMRGTHKEAMIHQLAEIGLNIAAKGR